MKSEGVVQLLQELPDEVFGSPLKDHLIYEAVLAYRAAGRRGTHATKNRSDVRGAVRFTGLRVSWWPRRGS